MLCANTHNTHTHTHTSCPVHPHPKSHTRTRTHARARMATARLLLIIAFSSLTTALLLDINDRTSVLKRHRGRKLSVPQISPRPRRRVHSVCCVSQAGHPPPRPHLSHLRCNCQQDRRSARRKVTVAAGGRASDAKALVACRTQRAHRTRCTRGQSKMALACKVTCIVSCSLSCFAEPQYLLQPPFFLVCFSSANHHFILISPPPQPSPPRCHDRHL